MNVVLRREVKYELQKVEAFLFAGRLEQLMQQDSFSKNGAYCVRSLYFDTVDDKDFFDKVNEQEVRQKVRLRIYNPNDQFAKLELKQKQNIFQKKQSLTISKEHALQLIDGNASVLLSYNHPFADTMFQIISSNLYRPKTIIEYRRRAFMAKENHIRLTFDSDIYATESSYDLFSDKLNLNPVFDLNKVIFEVKYDKFLLGYISEMISRVDRQPVTASKYCLGRSGGYPLYL